MEITTIEQWRAAEGFPNYEVSNTGRIRNRNTKRIISSFPGHRTGRMIVRIRRDGRYHTKRLTSLVATAFLGPCPQGMQIDHLDGNKVNDAASNLEYVSPSENIQRSYDRGQHPYRPAVDRYFTDADHEEMKRLYADGKGISQVQISKRFKCNNSTVSKIVRGICRTRNNAIRGRSLNEFREAAAETLLQMTRGNPNSIGKYKARKLLGNGISMGMASRILRIARDKAMGSSKGT